MNTEAKVKEWVSNNVMGDRRNWDNERPAFSEDDISSLITSCINDLTPGVQDEWISIDDELPKSKHDHVDCYIVVGGNVYDRPFNIHHKCFDNRDYDDFEYSIEEVSDWMYAPDFPNPPTK